MSNVTDIHNTRRDGSRLKGYLWIFITVLIFSSFEPVAKMASGILQPLQFTTLRFFIGGVFLIPFAWRALKKVKEAEGWTTYIQEKRDIRDVILLGFIIATVAMTIYQFAVTLIPASIAAPILCTAPVFTTFFAWLFTKAKIRWYNIAAICVSLVGIAFMFNTGGAEISTVGLILAVIATVGLALYSVYCNRTAKRYGGLVITCFSQIAGGVITGVVLALGNIGPIADALTAGGLGFFANVGLFDGITWDVMPLMLYIWIINSGLGYVTNMKAISATSPVEASLVYFIKIGVGPMMSMIILGEVISGRSWLSIAIVSVGSLIGLVPGLMAAWREHKAEERLLAQPESSKEKESVPAID